MTSLAEKAGARMTKRGRLDSRQITCIVLKREVLIGYPFGPSPGILTGRLF